MFRFNIHLLIFRRHAFGGTLNTHRYKHTHRFILSVVIYSSLLWWKCVSVFERVFFLKYLTMFFFWLIYCISYHIQMGKKDSQQAFDASISSYKSMKMITIEVAPRHFYSFFLVTLIWKICQRKLFYENKIFPENWHVDSVSKPLFSIHFFHFYQEYIISTKSNMFK